MFCKFLKLFANDNCIKVNNCSKIIISVKFYLVISLPNVFLKSNRPSTWLY